MTWWQTLIVAVVPVLVTLLITSVAESKRRTQDAAQREQDRTTDRQTQADARRASIEDHWRNERFMRMTALVDLVSDLTRLVIDAKSTLALGDDEPADLRKAVAVDVRKQAPIFAKQKESDLPQAVTQVAVIASQRFYVYALGMLDEIRQGFKPLFDVAIDRLESPSDFAHGYQVATEFAQEMSLINTRLINAVREELTGDTDSFLQGGH